MATPNSFTKQPTEQYPIAIEFANHLPINTSLNSVLVTAKNSDTSADTTGTVISGLGSVVGTQAKVVVTGGTDGERHTITFTVTLDDGSILVEDIIMKIVD